MVDFEFENLDLIAHNHADFFQTFQRVERFQQVLLLLAIGDEVGGQHVGKAGGRFQGDNRVDILR